MKLNRLHMKNFRCFEELSLQFGKRLTVVIADNGAGKTALLDAIALGFGRYLTKLPGISGQSPKDTDLRISAGERKEPFMMLAWEAETFDGRSVVWATGRKRDNAVTSATIKRQLSETQQSLYAQGLKSIDEFTLDLVQAESDQQPYFVPVIAYYGTNRAIRDDVKRRRGFKKKFSRFDALKDALTRDSSFRAAFEWFNAMEDAERREREVRRDFDYRHPELQAVRTAIERLLSPNFRNPRTEIRPLRFVIDRIMPNGTIQTFRISQLSDGYRVVLGLAMDLARRLMEANSGLIPAEMQGESPLDFPAIVLIDEIDLHLHPSWQQRIVTDLMQTFRNAQFIVSTHSPQVLSTVKRENIRIIGPGPDGRIVAEPPLAMTYGEPSGDVLHSVMMVDPQPPICEKADLQRLTELVDQGRYLDDDAVRLMRQLTENLGEQHPQLQRLRRSIQRQEALKK